MHKFILREKFALSDFVSGLKPLGALDFSPIYFLAKEK